MELHPLPIEAHLTRIQDELAARSSIYDLPSRRFYRPDPGLDLSVPFRASRAATPAGPAAGPQSQLAQNVVLAWLAGARVIELKTVQVDDRLAIPRPCIDVRTGYDLAVIRTMKLSGFVRGMVDATPTIERLRARLARHPEHRRWADLDYDPNVAAGITLSTFHGCPAGEIEGICRYLLEELGVHVVVKLNPTLLGYEMVEQVIRGELGYSEIELDRHAFDVDLKWDEAQGIVERLDSIARARGLTVGVKFSNTLVVKNNDSFFKGETTQYMSGPPLHVLAIALAARFRARYADRFGISFSAGVDARNFPDLVACDLAPITSCTDLLKAGGYSRMTGYLEAAEQRMRSLGVRTRDELILAARGNGARAALEVLPTAVATEVSDHLSAKGDKDVLALLRRHGLEARYGALVARAGEWNLEDCAAAARHDPRARKAQNAKAPRKIGSRLWFFDCVSCDKCIQVCPNDANFFLDVKPFRAEVTDEVVVLGPGQAEVRKGRPYRFERVHQLANYGDFCNECGNCDVFCPEDGGPYVVKPRFFGSRGSYLEALRHDGFYLETLADGGVKVTGRIDGVEHVLVRSPGQPDRFEDDGLALELDPDTGKVLSARPFFRAKPGHVLGTWRYVAVRALLDGVLAAGAATPVGAAFLSPR